MRLLPLLILCLTFLPRAAMADDKVMSAMPPPDWDTVVVLGTNDDRKAELSWQWWVANYSYEGGQAYAAATPQGSASSLADLARQGGLLAWPTDDSGAPWPVIGIAPPIDQQPEIERIYVESGAIGGAPRLYAAAHDPADGEPPRWWLWRSNPNAWAAQHSGADPLVRDHPDWAVHYALQGLSIAIKEASWLSPTLSTSLGDLLRDRQVVLIEESRTALRNLGYQMIAWYLPFAQRVVIDIRHPDHPAFFAVIPLDRSQILLTATRDAKRALALEAALGAPPTAMGLLGMNSALLWGDVLSMDGLPVSRISELGQ